MFTRCARVLLLVLALTQISYAVVDEVIDVIRLGKEIGEEILSSWDIIGRPFNASSGVELPVVRRQERLVLARLARISHTIGKLQIGIDNVNAVALMIAKNGARGTRLELRLHEMADLLSRVTSADRHMREYVGLQQELEKSTLQDFAEWCVSHDPGALPGLLERIHSLVVPPHKHLLGRGLMQLLLDDVQVFNNIKSIFYLYYDHKYSKKIKKMFTFFFTDDTNGRL